MFKMVYITVLLSITACAFMFLKQPPRRCSRPLKEQGFL